ncbi:MAG TPA: TonB-dependent receptor [Terriglobales bacterium]|nr:TonB-dependent receptor [Terriglobales bacterium]
MRKGILISTLFCALFTFLSVVGFAQESSVKGNLVGTVVDSTGAVVPGAKVTATGPGGTYTATSDNTGSFSFTRLDPGQYTVKVEGQGFKAADVKGAVVAVGRTSNLKISLAPGVATETVEVNATAVTVDTTSSATGSNLSDAFYNAVPVPRNVSGLFYVAPGVDDSGGAGKSNPSISGGSGLENLYIADGVNITDAAFGGLGIFTRIYDSVGTGINLSFIKEVQVKTGGFEPQYGQSTGGVVQIVTKSGSNAYHGSLGFFGAPRWGAATPKQRDNFRNNKVGQDFFSSGGPGIGNLFAGPAAYDISGEIGGYVPHFRENLFFFGSYNPSLNTDYITPPQFAGSPQFFQSQGFTGTPPQVGLFTTLGGKPAYLRAFTNNYAAKLTYKLNNSHTLETSVFGDPTSTNNAPFRIVNAQDTTVYSKINFQTRNFVARYNGTFSPTWLVDANFTWNHNAFTETPGSPNVFGVTDRTLTGLSPVLEGLGFVENHNANNFGYTIDTSKTVRFLGTHTFMLGGNETLLNYDNIKARSGGFFPVPDLGPAGNAAVYGPDCTAPNGTDLCPLGHLMDVQFSLRKTKASVCPSCPLYTRLDGTQVPVFLLSSRAEYGPPTVATEGAAYAVYGNDSWQMNKHLSLSLGLRWEQYRMAGVQQHFTFIDNWAPRLGIVYDPLGDRKSKVYLNWARYNYQMPLDAAIRSLSNELDLFGLIMRPEISADNKVTVVPDAAHVLNQQFGAQIANSAQGGGGEGFANGTKMQYEDEYVAGLEHEFPKGIVVSARYIDRRLRRVVEDMGGVSPEAALAGIPQIFLIGNPHAGGDLFTNEPVPTLVPNTASCPAGTVASASQDANFSNFTDGLQACFTAPNGVDAASGLPLGTNGQIAGTPIPDGISDGFVTPVRNYQAAELEVNKAFSAGWLMRFNYRLAYLRGNYEGAFRNDNGQTDPSISSLFDFTSGVMNLLGDQFAVGPLNTDRHHVANLFASYTFSNSMLKGLTLGTGMRIQSGTPISEFANHPVYGNAGEVPLGGRGLLGRTQPTGAIDLHGEYARKMSERYTLHLVADMFNVTNSLPVATRDQLRDLSFQAPGSNLVQTLEVPPNPGAGDFLTPTSFQNPFYARFGVRIQF